MSRLLLTKDLSQWRRKSAPSGMSREMVTSAPLGASVSEGQGGDDSDLGDKGDVR